MTVLMMVLASFKDRLEERDPAVAPEIHRSEQTQFIYMGKQLVYPKLKQELDHVQNGDPENQNKPNEFDASILMRGLDGLDRGTLAQRWFYAILLNELKGASAARASLELTRSRLDEAGIKPTEQQDHIQGLLNQLFEQYEQGDFTQSHLEEDDRQLLKDQLEWYGELVLAPRESGNLEARESLAQQSQSSSVTWIVGFLVGLLALFVGFVALVASIVFAAVKWMKPKFVTNDSNPNIYIETFAIWLVIFVAGQVLMGLLLSRLNVGEGIQRMGWGVIPFVGSLVALGWPIWRGMSVKQLRSDIGWKWGNPFAEVGSAVQFYLATLPLLLGGLIFFAMVVALTSDRPPTDFSGRDMPSHPVQEVIGDGDAWTIGIVLLLASFAAPLVEETMFRGVLYRHLRNGSRSMAIWLSVIGATLLNSFIFAAIHPQGLLAIPMLMALAIGFSFTREYRDSLVAPMLMHSVHNFLVMMFSFWMMS